MKHFTHLHCHSYFSFLDGCNSPEELLQKAASLEMPALALTDHNNLCGAVRFQSFAEKINIKPILGCEITLENNHHLTLLAENTKGYNNLCRILTESYKKGGRYNPLASFSTLENYRDNIIALSGCYRGEIPGLLLKGKYSEALQAAARYLHIFGQKNFYLEMQNLLHPGNKRLNNYLNQLAEHLKINTAAANNVHYLGKDNFFLHDILTCIRTNTTLNQIHVERHLNGENYLKSFEEMKSLFKAYPLALNNSWEIAQRCRPSLPRENRLFPLFTTPPGTSSAAFFKKIVYQGAARRYPKLTQTIKERLEHEMDIIIRLGFQDYFLLVWDLVRHAAERGIRYAGRGSAADSVVAFSLGITEVDPIARGLLFERFMSLERAEKPDIDIDFDARHRDKMIDYLIKRYGKDKVASVCTYNTFKARAAVRDIGKALEVPPAELDQAAKLLPHIYADRISDIIEKLPELKKSSLDWQKYRQLFEFCSQAAGLPRFLGTHLGGVVIASVPLNQITPLQPSADGLTITQFDKDDIEAFGLVKLDLLSLKTMSAVEDCCSSIKLAERDFDYEAIPYNDQSTFQMLQRGETIGVFQLESPAQRGLQTRLKASHMEDIVASLALIRPGPIKGNMVDPFIARRQGLEAITYLHPKLKPILEKTYGVVLFQEQVIEIATKIAGFSPGEADQIRRVMTKARSYKEMERIGENFIAKAQLQGVSKELAEVIFSYIVSYASYGFCEAHAASFAGTAYKTAYLLNHHPAHFLAALLSNQPMGFYDSQTLCVEAKRRGIDILPPHINLSENKFTVEKGNIRVSLKQVKGMQELLLGKILEARLHKKFTSLKDFYERTGTPKDICENIILSGAFDELEGNRRSLLWKLGKILKGREDLDGSTAVADFTPEKRRELQYKVLGIHVEAHPMGLLRSALSKKGFYSSEELKKLPDKAHIKTAGIPIRPQRPPVRSGKTMVFFSLEDEKGLVDVTVFENIYQQFGQYIYTTRRRPLVVSGHISKRGEGFSLIAREISFL
ncbi:MAG: DNA polymerase III subunit alpha [Bacillota bacterium]